MCFYRTNPPLSPFRFPRSLSLSSSWFPVLLFIIAINNPESSQCHRVHVGVEASTRVILSSSINSPPSLGSRIVASGIPFLKLTHASLEEGSLIFRALSVLMDMSRDEY